MKASPSALDRLTRSRERLRLALLGLPPVPDESAAAAPWKQRIAALPGASVVLEAIQHWWARHPLRGNIQLAIYATQSLVQPIAKRHPLVLVVSAFAIGGLLARSHPLQGLIKPALFAGLLQQLVLASMSAKAQPPPPV